MSFCPTQRRWSAIIMQHNHINRRCHIQICNDKTFVMKTFRTNEISVKREQPSSCAHRHYHHHQLQQGGGPKLKPHSFSICWRRAMHFHETTPTHKKGRGCGWWEASLVASGTLPVTGKGCARCCNGWYGQEQIATWLNADDKNAMM